MVRAETWASVASGCLVRVNAACAGAVLVLYEAAIFFTAILLCTTLAVFLASAILLLLVLACNHRGVLLWILTGLAAGFA